MHAITTRRRSLQAVLPRPALVARGSFKFRGRKAMALPALPLPVLASCLIIAGGVSAR